MYHYEQHSVVKNVPLNNCEYHPGESIPITLLNRQQSEDGKPNSRLKPVGRELLFSPVLPYAVSRQSYWDGVGYTAYYGNPSGGYCYLPVANSSRWFLWPSPVIPFEMPLNHKLLLKIKNQKVSLGVMMAEYREAASLIANACGFLVGLARCLGNPKGRGCGMLLEIISQKNYIRDIPNSWLMYRYGIQPLISDVLRAVDLLKSADNFAPITRARVSHRVALEDPSRGDSPFHIPTGGISVKEFHRIHHIGYVEWDDSMFQTWRQTGISNPLEIFYELIPFSFVVDWVFNIGNAISALDALGGATRYKLLYTHKILVSYEWPTGAHGTFAGYRREHLSGVPDMPRYEPSLSRERLADALSLLYTVAIKGRH